MCNTRSTITVAVLVAILKFLPALYTAGRPKPKFGVGLVKQVFFLKNTFFKFLRFSLTKINAGHKITTHKQ